MNRAYAILEVKSIQDDLRIIEGVASTPAPDRLNDVIVPDGIQYKLPLPLLDHHQSHLPIGNVISAKITKDGMSIKAQVAKPGVADHIDKAWNLIKAGLVRGFSVGFRSIEESFDKQLNGFKYLKTEILEISVVTIPANAEATITAIKSACLEPAALGKEATRRGKIATTLNRGVPQSLGKQMKTIQEQIAALEASRVAALAKKDAIWRKVGDEGRTMDETEQQEFDELQSEVRAVDSDLQRLREHEESMTKATPISETAAASEELASAARGGSGAKIRVKAPELPKGTAFTRYAIALARSRGNLMQAAEVAKQWRDSTPQVETVLKAAVAAGTTTDATWAAPLVDYTFMASEFIEFLRPQTIIGRIPGLRRVPFNIKVPLQDAGSSVQWVGQGVRKPVSKLSFDTATLTWAKAAGIVVLTDELVRFSNPSAEMLVRDDLAASMRTFLDEQFIDPAVTAVPNVSPASITNGATNTAASGTDATAVRDDFKTILTALLNANIVPTGGVWVMQPVLAVSISLILNALGQPEFPLITADGGSLLGYQVVTSNSVPSGNVVFLKPSEIFLADDGQLMLDASREASVVMDDGGSPSVTTMVSFWQANLIGLRAERYINWQRRRDDAVYYLTGAAYAA